MGAEGKELADDTGRWPATTPQPSGIHSCLATSGLRSKAEELAAFLCLGVMEAALTVAA